MQVQQTTNEDHPYSFQVSGKERTLELQARCVCVRSHSCLRDFANAEECFLHIVPLFIQLRAGQR